MECLSEMSHNHLLVLLQRVKQAKWRSGEKGKWGQEEGEKRAEGQTAEEDTNPKMILSLKWKPPAKSNHCSNQTFPTVWDWSLAPQGVTSLNKVCSNFDLLALTDRYTIKIRACIQIKLPHIKIPTHTRNTHTGRHRKKQPCMFLLMRLEVCWSQSSSASYGEHWDHCACSPLWYPTVPQLQSPLENHNIWGRQTFSVNAAAFSSAADGQNDGENGRSHKPMWRDENHSSLPSLLRCAHQSSWITSIDASWSFTKREVFHNIRLIDAFKMGSCQYEQERLCSGSSCFYDRTEHLESRARCLNSHQSSFTVCP